MLFKIVNHINNRINNLGEDRLSSLFYHLDTDIYYITFPNNANNIYAMSNYSKNLPVY